MYVETMETVPLQAQDPVAFWFRSWTLLNVESICVITMYSLYDVSPNHTLQLGFISYSRLCMGVRPRF